MPHAPVVQAEEVAATHAATALSRTLDEGSSTQDAQPSKEQRIKERRKSFNADSTGSARLVHVQIVTALMRGTKSRKDLVRETGASARTVADFLRLLHDQGAVYFSGYRCQQGSTMPSEMYTIQRVPFECPDVEREM